MVGLGYDLHKLALGRKLFLGGVEIPSDLGCIAHSDGDVVLHALCDALLGAAALGDIGEHFPNNDLRYKDASSSMFVEAVLNLPEMKKYEIVNIDVTIVLETPKLSSYKHSIKESIASICSIHPKKVNIKAKTNEGLDSVGRSESVAAWVVVQLGEYA
jgi:2-C-methyl-D-erythritol 2,4-cyclodiphosphate synthase